MEAPRNNNNLNLNLNQGTQPVLDSRTVRLQAYLQALTSFNALLSSGEVPLDRIGATANLVLGQLQPIYELELKEIVK